MSKYFNTQPTTPAQEDGWIDPNGNFYSCEYGFHENFAQTKDAWADDLERRGWLHISAGVVKNDLHRLRLTQSQIDTMGDIISEKPNSRRAVELNAIIHMWDY